MKDNCIDLMIRNRPICFQSAEAVETSWSDFRKMMLTVIELFYQKQNPNTIIYRSYNFF